MVVILACKIARAKIVAFSELREIARVAYLGQIMNIGSCLTRKLYQERSWEVWVISVRDWAREKGCHLEIARNHMGSIFRPNNKYWKQLPAKIIKGAL